MERVSLAGPWERLSLTGPWERLSHTGPWETLSHGCLSELYTFYNPAPRDDAQQNHLMQFKKTRPAQQQRIL